MPFPALLIACGLSLLALAYVLYPLYHDRLAKPALASRLPKDVQSSASDSEQAARLSLQEVELDYQLGNIAEADYRSLRERYIHRAIRAMKLRHANTSDEQSELEYEQATPEQDADIDALIEEQLRRMREQRGDEGGNEDNDDE